MKAKTSSTNLFGVIQPALDLGQRAIYLNTEDAERLARLVAAYNTDHSSKMSESDYIGAILTARANAMFGEDTND